MPKLPPKLSKPPGPPDLGAPFRMLRRFFKDAKHTVHQAAEDVQDAAEDLHDAVDELKKPD